MGDEQIFDDLGFTWDRSVVPTGVPVHSVERAVFRLHKALPEFVWDASMLEGNPFTFPEVQTLLDGITVGGHKISDERQVLNLADSARDEAFDAGHFRGEGAEQQLTPGVGLGEHGRHMPPETQPGGENLRQLHARGLAAITGGLPTAYGQGLVYFLFGALRQFYFDGNKRTARFMMNGHLMSHGIDAISVPARRAHEFNTLMVEFYRFRDATRMIAFLTDCHPDADELMTPPLRSLLDDSSR
jgi:hypothetical protein